MALIAACVLPQHGKRFSVRTSGLTPLRTQAVHHRTQALGVASTVDREHATGTFEEAGVRSEAVAGELCGHDGVARRHPGVQRLGVRPEVLDEASGRGCGYAHRDLDLMLVQPQQATHAGTELRELLNRGENRALIGGH